jgi:hypothetical protein
MATTPPSVELELLPAEGADEGTVEKQTTDLAGELRAVRGVVVERAESQAPADAKGLGFAAIGSLLVSLTGAGGAVTALVGVLASWVGREQGRKIRVKIGDRELELTGGSREEEQQLIEEFRRSGHGD